MYPSNVETQPQSLIRRVFMLLYTRCSIRSITAHTDKHHRLVLKVKIKVCSRGSFTRRDWGHKFFLKSDKVCAKIDIKVAKNPKSNTFISMRNPMATKPMSCQTTRPIGRKNSSGRVSGLTANFMKKASESSL